LGPQSHVHIRGDRLVLKAEPREGDVDLGIGIVIISTVLSALYHMYQAMATDQTPKFSSVESLGLCCRSQTPMTYQILTLLEHGPDALCLGHHL